MLSPPKRILIVRTGALGDVVNCLPLAVALKDEWPENHLSWVVHPLAAPILLGHRAVDEVIVWDKAAGVAGTARLILGLRRGNFDLVLDLGRGIKSALVALAAGGKRRIGFDRSRSRELAWLLGGERVSRPPAAPRALKTGDPLERFRCDPEPGGHVVNQYLEFARHLGLPPRPVRFDLTPPPDAYDRAQTLWPDGAGLKLAVVTGATKRANRWPEPAWVELIGRATRELGARVALVGSPAELPLGNRIAAAAGGPVAVAMGRTTIPELTGLLAGADAVVACDTGPLHLAVALGRPVVALFGAADPGRTGPYRDSAPVVTEGLPCSPCRQRACPRASDSPCMDRISPAAVTAALCRALGVAPPRP
jgi:ADP-heptose:LPS heptosyltransferase